MLRRARFGLCVIAPLLWAGPAAADAEEFETLWSATLMGQFQIIASQEADDDVTGFFDQYEFVPNKSSALPFELGVRDAAFDLFDSGGTPRIRFRWESPTSNLGVSGSQIDEPFLNQRGELLGRFDGFDFDIDYRRFRTEELRLFPNEFGAWGLAFTDLTRPDDLFSHDRTGFYGGLRLRPQELLASPGGSLDWLAPELTLRGGYQSREGERQFRFLSTDWLAITQELDQSVGEVGGGLLVAPGGLFTMVFDFDYTRFRNSPTVLDSDLGSPYPATSRPIGFIPDTDRSTGSVRLHRRFGQRAVLEGGFQASWLEQVGDRTPAQQAAGLRDNNLLFYSANLAADVLLADRVSANAFFKYDQRDNKIDRDTALFNPGTQQYEFLEQLRRIVAGAEAVYRPFRASQFALGARFEWIDRDLDPATSPIRILPENWLVADETQMWTVYGRAKLRPVKGLSLRGELGYRGAPKTGYIVDLDDYVYGKLRASYVVPLKRPIVLSAFAQGGSGENHDFSMVDGLGPSPAGPELGRDFDRSSWLWGLTASASPWQDVTAFASFYQSRDAQDYGLVLSDFQRYFQNIIPLNFSRSGSIEYRNDQMSFILGTHVQLSERTDAGLSYSFTRAESDYAGASPEIQLIRANSSIDGDIHGLDFEVGHWLMDGLRVVVGYRLQYYTDRAPVPSGTGSVVSPFNLSTYENTVTLGVTLTSDLLAKKD
ncbi:MAG: hypothetical protein OEM05_05805 [Myxococcales bacterium]|nr:hypothetical protein [Myxococcales bacterium]